MNVTAAVSVKAPVSHASFQETHHRESDGVSSSCNLCTRKCPKAGTWRSRANAKPITVVRITHHAV